MESKELEQAAAVGADVLKELADMGMELKSATMDDVPVMLGSLVIYHGGCDDGFSAAWVFWHMQNFIEHSFDFHAGKYGEKTPDLSNYEEVFFVDFSYKRAQVEDILQTGKSVIFIDHHKTAIEDLAGLEEEYPDLYTAYTDMKRSGAMLAWDYWNNTQWVQPSEEVPEGYTTTLLPGMEGYREPPLLLDYIQDRDLWTKKLHLTEEVSLNVKSQNQTFENWESIMMALDPATLPRFAEGGASILRKHLKDINNHADHATFAADVCGYIVPVVNAPYEWGSDICSLLLERYPKAPFAVYYFDSVDHRGYGFRSQDSRIDVGAIALSLGGGGHRNASGAKLPHGGTANIGQILFLNKEYSDELQ